MSKERMEKTVSNRSLVTSKLSSKGSQAQLLLAQRENSPVERSKIRLI